MAKIPRIIRRTEEVAAGSRTDRLEASAAADGTYSIDITEFLVADRDWEYHGVAVPEEHLAAFRGALASVAQAVGGKPKSYSVQAIRIEHP